ncbi:MAG: pectate lyase [Bacteroides sp.]|jgi:pectinesterase|nr:pectate lyase [Bacteroides sp.]
MKKIYLCCLAVLLSLTNAFSQETINYKEKQSYKNWVRIAPRFDDAFFKTPEAVRIADNVLLYQQTTGGWPKNIYMPAEIKSQEMDDVIASKDNVNESTIDNGATTTEIRYLSRVYQATNIEKYRNAALDGIRYLIKSQYANGGWPQFWPRNKGYYTHITYNDNAMINVMNQLREIYEKQAPYTYAPDDICQKAKKAFEKGIECILATQVKQNGKLTVWCAQHDERTLAPAKARAYELPSLSGQESDDIVLLLMSLPHPSKKIIASVEAAVEWFKASEIKGIKRETFINAEGKKDFRMVPCTDCGPLWARFYTLEDNRPFFCDRDGIKKYNISEIGYERRNGYSWYNDNGLKVLKKYTKWEKGLNKTTKTL